jgi:signal transduction histidine kinase
LSAILGWARMLRMGQLTADDSGRALETIERNARAQSQLIDDLLDVSRIITGKLRMDVRPSDPNSFIDAAVESVRPAAEAKGVRVQKSSTLDQSRFPVIRYDCNRWFGIYFRMRSSSRRVGVVCRFDLSE